MSQTTPRLALPLIQPAQAQKHVTHNEALVLLDALAHLTLAGTGAETPPASAADGEAWALGPLPTGLWQGQGGAVAVRSNGGWVFAAPRAGWRAWDTSEDRALRHNGMDWIEDGAPETVPQLGIGTAPDATNRLAVASDAVLLTHAGTDARLVLNRAGDADVASLLFQSGWSGRAEMGLASGGGFEIRASPDGASWSTGLRVTGAGTVEAPAGLSFGGAVLSSYEAGAWTPLLTAQTPPASAAFTATGSYVRIGALVQARLSLSVADPGAGGAGPVLIDGLPAAAAVGPAPAGIEAAGMPWGVADQALRVDGTTLGLGRSAAPLDWSAMGPGATIKAAFSYALP